MAQQTRREFIKNSAKIGVALGAVAAFPSLLNAANSSVNSNLNSAKNSANSNKNSQDFVNFAVNSATNSANSNSSAISNKNSTSKGVKMQTITLANGVKMPLVGFGTFQITGEKCTECVKNALGVGYRLIDTAQAYYNEAQVGKAIAQSGVPRGEIFLTTKIWVSNHSAQKARKSLLESLDRLQTPYIDLVLIHQPLSNYYAAYEAMEELHKEGKIKSLGISNFSSERMADIATFCSVKPVVNQVETHLFFQQKPMREWLAKYKIAHQAWGPLSQHRISEVLKHPQVSKIAQKHGKSPAQIALKFAVQQGICVIPKTTSVARMRENLALFDFALSDSELKTLGKIDENKSMWAAYDDPNIVQYAMSDDFEPSK